MTLTAGTTPRLTNTLVDVSVTVWQRVTVEGSSGGPSRAVTRTCAP